MFEFLLPQDKGHVSLHAFSKDFAGKGKIRGLPTRLLCNRLGLALFDKK